MQFVAQQIAASQHPRILQARTIYSRKKRSSVLPITCVSAKNPRPRCRRKLPWNGIPTCLEATILSRVLCQNWTMEDFLNIKTKRVLPTDKVGIFSTLVSLKSLLILLKKFSSSVLSSSYNISSLELWKNVQQHRKGAFVSPTILFPIRSVYIMRECMRTKFSANSGLRGPIPLNVNQSSLPRVLLKKYPMSLLRNARPDPSYAKKISIF